MSLFDKIKKKEQELKENEKTLASTSNAPLKEYPFKANVQEKLVEEIKSEDLTLKNNQNSKDDLFLDAVLTYIFVKTPYFTNMVSSKIKIVPDQIKVLFDGNHFNVGSLIFDYKINDIIYLFYQQIGHAIMGSRIIDSQFAEMNQKPLIQTRIMTGQVYEGIINYILLNKPEYLMIPSECITPTKQLKDSLLYPHFENSKNHNWIDHSMPTAIKNMMLTALNDKEKFQFEEPTKLYFFTDKNNIVEDGNIPPNTSCIPMIIPNLDGGTPSFGESQTKSEESDDESNENTSSHENENNNEENENNNEENENNSMSWDKNSENDNQDNPSDQKESSNQKESQENDNDNEEQNSNSNENTQDNQNSRQENESSNNDDEDCSNSEENSKENSDSKGEPSSEEDSNSEGDSNSGNQDGSNVEGNPENSNGKSSSGKNNAGESGKEGESKSNSTGINYKSDIPTKFDNKDEKMNPDNIIKDIMNSHTGYSPLGNYIQERYIELITVKARWDLVLKNLLKQYLPATEYSYTRPHKNSMVLPVLIPGKSAPREETVIEKIQVFVDTSGSIDNETLQQSVNTILSFKDYVKNGVEIATFTTTVSEIIKIKNFKINFDDPVFKRTGGTCIKQIAESFKPKDSGKVLRVFITDGDYVWDYFKDIPIKEKLLFIIISNHRATASKESEQKYKEMWLKNFKKPKNAVIFFADSSKYYKKL